MRYRTPTEQELQDLAAFVKEAYFGRTPQEYGAEQWDEFVRREVGELNLSKRDRKVLVYELAVVPNPGTGSVMSIRAVAVVVGAGNSTVWRDIQELTEGDS